MNTAHPPRPGRKWRKRWALLGVAGLLVLALAGWAARGRWRGKTEIPGGDLTPKDREVAVALQVAREGVARQPKSAASWGHLGKLYQVHNYFEPALRCYAQAAKLDGTDPTWPYLRGTLLQISPEPADAIPDLRRAVEVSGGSPLMRLRLGELLLELGQHQDAAAEFEAVLAEHPKDPRAHLRMAAAAAAAGRWSDVLPHLDAVEETSHSRRASCHLRIQANQRLGKQQEAARLAERSRDLPEDAPWPDPFVEDLANHQVGARARLARALLLMGQERVPEAVALMQQAAEDYPENALIWSGLGRVQALAGDLPAADRALSRSLEIAPEMADIWLILGVVRGRQKDLPGALRCFQTSTRLRPTDTEAYCYLGDCLAEVGDEKGALAAYREALRIQPNYQKAQDKVKKIAGTKGEGP